MDACTKARVSGPPHLVANVVAQPARRRLLVHLVNYNNQEPVANAQVAVKVPEGWRVKRADLLTPEHPAPVPLKFEQAGDRVSFSVPSVKNYALISLEAR